MRMDSASCSGSRLASACLGGKMRSFAAKCFNGRLGINSLRIAAADRKICLFHVGCTAKSHYDAGGAPVRDPGSTGMNRGSTGMNQGSTGDDRNEPGTNGNNRGSTGKVLKGRTGNYRRSPGNNQDGTVTTGTKPQLHQGPYRPLQS
ncbi:hypothetical protein DPMN_162324 [Dreissena polymorpha]|uniref:Uncharacterized protein n=1 Tax=Dreissena polymorpha TaxID=45954 RepID=A0A9D4IRX0_DREPO|nr:hypothetical protein DPMN_162324 [Dreissena polymorpha]